jgi:hypothetical protein
MARKSRRRAGQYFELDRDADRDIANAIIDAGRRQTPATTEHGTTEELYWRFLAAGLGLVALGSVFVRDDRDRRGDLGLARDLIGALTCAHGRATSRHSIPTFSNFVETVASN